MKHATYRPVCYLALCGNPQPAILSFHPILTMKNVHLFIFLLAATVSLSACNSGTDKGDTNVESSGAKENTSAQTDGTPAGDSATSGMRRAPSTQVSGKEQFEKADQTVDRNKDGLAD